MDRPARIAVALLIIAVIEFFIYSKLAGWHKKKAEALGEKTKLIEVLRR